MPVFPIWDGDKAAERAVGLNISYARDIVDFKRTIAVGAMVVAFILLHAPVSALGLLAMGAVLSVAAYNAFRLYGARKHPERDMAIVVKAERKNRAHVRRTRREAASTSSDCSL